ncbi:hypothetical protein GGS21DRAFT_483467 [Xylaria nigripes]|nr:hypothetical protein GGS21DRAFT_483467 [Xylaria nigripes]
MGDRPPPPPPHGTNPRKSSPNLPPGKYDIFIIPPHSSGAGFLYLPSLKPNVNSFAAGFASALVLVVFFQAMAPIIRLWLGGFQGLGNMGVLLLVIAVAVGSWTLGRTQSEGRSGNRGGAKDYWSYSPGENGNAGGSYPGTGPAPNSTAPDPDGPPPPPPPHATPPPPRSSPSPNNDESDKPKPSEQERPQAEGTKGSWEKAREETRQEEERRKAKEAEQRKKEEIAKRLKELREKEAKERAKREQEAQERREQEAREREAREQEIREKLEKEVREKAEREKAAKEKDEKEARERENRLREEKEKREREKRIKEAREREIKEKLEKEARVREAREREAKEKLEKEAREARERQEKERREAKERQEKERREAKERQEVKEAKERIERELREAKERQEKRMREAKEKQEKEMREAKERQEKEAREKELREKELREQEEKEKARKEKELKEKRIQEARERELRERLEREKALREKLEREAKEREIKEREAKEREAKEREAAQKLLAEAARAAEEEARAKEKAKEAETARRSTYAFSSVGEKTNPWPNGKPPTEAPSPAKPTDAQDVPPPTPPHAAPSSVRRPAPSMVQSSRGTDEETYSYRPYDQPKAHVRRKSGETILTESSYAPSQFTTRTTPPPSMRGAYTTKDPDKIVIRAVYGFLNQFSKTPASSLVSGVGPVTDGLILRITTEGLFIDDDVRGVPQREWDVKAWTLKLMEVWCPAHNSADVNASPRPPSKQAHTRFKFSNRGQQKPLTGDEADAYLTELLFACKDDCRMGPHSESSHDASSQGSQWRHRGLHVLRATIRDQEGKRYLFVLGEEEGWKVAVGLQRLRKGTQVRQLGIQPMPFAETCSAVETLGW